MTIDIQAIYITLAVLAFMIIIYIVAIKKIINIKSKFTSFLMVIEEIIGVCTFTYILAMTYKALEDYEVFVKQYGNLEDNFTFVSIYFCISQLIIYVLLWIYKAIVKRSKFIKKRRIIK